MAKLFNFRSVYRTSTAELTQTGFCRQKFSSEPVFAAATFCRGQVPSLQAICVDKNCTNTVDGSYFINNIFCIIMILVK
jgi:hypothetical protein